MPTEGVFIILGRVVRSDLWISTNEETPEQSPAAATGKCWCGGPKNVHFQRQKGQVLTRVANALFLVIYLSPKYALGWLHTLRQGWHYKLQFRSCSRGNEAWGWIQEECRGLLWGDRELRLSYLRTHTRVLWVSVYSCIMREHQHLPYSRTGMFGTRANQQSTKGVHYY